MAPRRHHSRGERGAVILEMTLVGIPLIFMLISIFEMSRGMWVYHTLSNAVKQGARYASVHGQDCSNLGNSCQVTVGQIATVIANAAVGLDPNLMQVTMCIDCGAPSFVTGVEAHSGTLATLVSSGTQWPSTPSDGSANADKVYLTVQYPFSSSMAMFWPGSRTVAGNGPHGEVKFGSVMFIASAGETFHF